MAVDTKLKQGLVEKLTKYYGSMSVYSIRKLSYNDMLENAMYYASRFMEKDVDKSFGHAQKEDDSIMVNLSVDVRMRIYHNSNTVIIKRKMNPLEHLFKEKSEIKDLSEIAIKAMKRLGLDKYRLPIEQLEFESLWQIKADAISIEKTREPVILCRIIGAFRRHINKIPVYGKASVLIKIAGDGLIDSVGIDWRPINENPVNTVKIINPETAAEKTLKDLNSILPNKTITSDHYEVESFQLGYCSMPKRRKQNYLQPVYIAMFKSLVSGWDRGIVIPATTHTYEPVSIAPQEHKSNKK